MPLQNRGGKHSKHGEKVPSLKDPPCHVFFKKMKYLAFCLPITWHIVIIVSNMIYFGLNLFVCPTYISAIMPLFSFSHPKANMSIFSILCTLFFFLTSIDDGGDGGNGSDNGSDGVGGGSNGGGVVTTCEYLFSLVTTPRDILAAGWGKLFSYGLQFSHLQSLLFQFSFFSNFYVHNISFFSSLLSHNYGFQLLNAFISPTPIWFSPVCMLLSDHRAMCHHDIILRWSPAEDKVYFLAPHLVIKY